MRKLFLVMAVLLLNSLAFAEPINLGTPLKAIPNLKQGVAFSLIDSKFNYLMTAKVVEIGKYINVEAGYAGSASETKHKAAVVVSANLLESGFIKFPVLKYLEFKPGIYAGVGNINVKDLRESEFDWGISASLVEIKF